MKIEELDNPKPQTPSQLSAILAYAGSLTEAFPELLNVVSCTTTETI